MVSRPSWFFVWALAAVMVLAATSWPPSAFVDHPHWGRISWVPLVDPGNPPWEILANALLFLPFGFAGFRALGAGARAVPLAVATAAALSLAVETGQVFAHGRFPSATDLLANTVGATLGALLAKRVRARASGSDA